MADLLTIQNFIGGRFVDCEAHIDSYDPSVGKPYARIPDSGKKEVDMAVEAAKKAFKSWSKTSAKERAMIMVKIADLLQSRLSEFAKAESKDQGKPVWLAEQIDIPRAVLNFRSFAGSIQYFLNKSSLTPNTVNYTQHSPVGVAALIAPWNLPLYLLTFKIAPAIAAGNTVVCKPSEMTSVTSWMLASVLNDAGLPPGVVNIVFGVGPKCGAALVEHPDVPLTSFTGSTATGQLIAEKSAPSFKKLSLELGGKNAGIIFEDANLEKCIQTCLRSSFINQGEVCLCTSRIFVQSSIYEKFLELFVKATTETVKVGRPDANDTKVGALISKEHLEKVKNYVKIARQEGGIIHCGEGKDPMPDLPEENKNGYFMLPTIITNLKDETTCMQEEIFGPVACVSPFDTEEEVIERANNVKYGLCAAVWSENVGRIHRVAQQLEVGTVWCNCWLVRDLNMPFGGVKSSGIGREGNFESLEFFTNVKTICVKY